MFRLMRRNKYDRITTSEIGRNDMRVLYIERRFYVIHYAFATARVIDDRDLHRTISSFLCVKLGAQIIVLYKKTYSWKIRSKFDHKEKIRIRTNGASRIIQNVPFANKFSRDRLTSTARMNNSYSLETV